MKVNTETRHGLIDIYVFIKVYLRDAPGFNVHFHWCCNRSGRFDAGKSYSTHHFSGNACTNSGPLLIAVFPVFRLLTDFVCLMIYEFYLSLWKIARCSVIFFLPLFLTIVFRLRHNYVYNKRNINYAMVDKIDKQIHDFNRDIIIEDQIIFMKQILFFL